MQNTWSIGRTWKPREGWSRPVLTDERQHSFPDLFGERIILLQTIPYGNEHGMNTRRINASRPLSGSQAATRPADLGVWPYKRRFAAVMAQVRRPVPFRTRKLRPGTAMVLHSTGCGRVARRRITRTGSPDTLKVPGLPAYRDTCVWGGVSRVLGPQRLGPPSPWSAARTTPLKEESQKLAWLWGRSTLASAMHYFTPKRCATSNKIMYHDKAQAQRAADQSLIERGAELWVYRCEYCGCWHLTHRDPQSSYRHVPLNQQLKPHSRKKGYKPRRR